MFEECQHMFAGYYGPKGAAIILDLLVTYLTVPGKLNAKLI